MFLRWITLLPIRQGSHEWRNIQPVLRHAFRAVLELVRSQGQQIDSLEQQLAQGVTREDLSSALTQRVSSKEFTARMRKVRGAVKSAQNEANTAAPCANYRHV